MTINPSSDAVTCSNCPVTSDVTEILTLYLEDRQGNPKGMVKLCNTCLEEKGWERKIGDNG